MSHFKNMNESPCEQTVIKDNPSIWQCFVPITSLFEVRLIEPGLKMTPVIPNLLIQGKKKLKNKK